MEILVGPTQRRCQRSRIFRPAGCGRGVSQQPMENNDPKIARRGVSSRYPR
jgi:hypothetical protein